MMSQRLQQLSFLEFRSWYSPIRRLSRVLRTSQPYPSRVHRTRPFWIKQALVWFLWYLFDQPWTIRWRRIRDDSGERRFLDRDIRKEISTDQRRENELRRSLKLTANYFVSVASFSVLWNPRMITNRWWWYFQRRKGACSTSPIDAL